MIAKIVMNVATVSSGSGSGNTLPAEVGQDIVVEQRIDEDDDREDREADRPAASLGAAHIDSWPGQRRPRLRGG